MPNFVYLAGETAYEGYYGYFFWGVPEVFATGEAALRSVLARRPEGSRVQPGSLASRKEGLPEKLNEEIIQAGWNPAWTHLDLHWLSSDGKTVQSGAWVIRRPIL